MFDCVLCQLAAKKQLKHLVYQRIQEAVQVERSPVSLLLYSLVYDIKREIRNLFIRTNILIRRYSKCSIAIKQILFKAYCMCLYDAGIWMQFSVTFLTSYVHITTDV